MLYDIKLTMRFDYSGLAGGGRHAIRVLPQTLGVHQRMIAGHVDVDPVPRERSARTDFFGNPVTDCAFDAIPDDLVYTAQARVERFAPVHVAADSALLADLASELEAARTLLARSPAHFLNASALVPPHAGVRDYAQKTTKAAHTIFDAAQALNAALHADMRYDAEATDVDTPLAEAFEARHGVCQDFSHIMIAGLRHVGIPAAYVSGYLRTIPPKGQPRLEGADAMHAWVSAWCGTKIGWVEFDPTNELVVAADHIVVGYGRDYADVPPVRGVIRTAGGQTATQAVDVLPLDQDLP
ncbi:MAG: transglutaminase domain-containing protein [Aliihoeflea sp.]